jgi:uncharacterized protein
MALETDLTLLAALAEDNQAFRYYIETIWEREARPDADLDTLVDGLTAEVSAQIDCTACANCCRGLRVGLTPADMLPMAEALHLTPEEVIARYVDQEQGAVEGEWGVMRQSPCALLRGNLCSIYPHRPESCRLYPAFTPDFRWLMEPFFDGAGCCPIIFHVIARLKQVLGWV